jgi:hypothetical protein
MPETAKRTKDTNRTYYALLSLLQSQPVIKTEKINIYKVLIRPVTNYEA